MQLKSLFTLALAIGTATVNAKVQSGCSFSTTTITDPADIATLNACPTIDGSIEITGDEITALLLPSVQEIDGNINIFNSSSIVTVSFNGLTSVNGTLAIQALTALNSIDFTSLQVVNELDLVSLPSLAGLTIVEGIQKANSIQLSDTALSVLPFTTFNTVGVLNINNNKNISSINLPLETVTDTLLLSFNNDHAEIVLDDLIWASNLTIQDVSSVSLKNLTAVNGSLILGYNTFTQVAADNLETVGVNVEIFANDDLTKISLSNLTTIGGELRLFNNTLLENVGNSSFESLSKIKGTLNAEGNFENFTLPALSQVAGDFNLISTNDDFDCDDFDALHSASKIQGHNYTCASPSSSSSESGSSSKTASGSESSSGSSSSSSPSSSSSSSKKSEAQSNLVSVSMVFMTLIGTVFTMLL
ncbi:uncharacterized protein RJT21DRAFT_113898 [Scheffersomyces amazonensis]|uniref:uncharacterized protein n=1 Tax=Scheffersomyces amazonensis TaxID=1078765 RepID=UPI00315D3353